MAGAKQRRRRKHRGTQAGTVRRRGRRSKPASRAEARATTRQRRIERLERPPSWRGALNRAALAAAVFFAVLVFLLNQPVNAALGLSAFMLLIYIPLGYMMDSGLYRFRQRRRQRQKES